MKMKIFKLLFFTFLLCFSAALSSQSYLKDCWQGQVKPLGKSYIASDFKESLYRLNHSFEPWQQTNYQSKGKVWSSANHFNKQDTLVSGSRTYQSKTMVSNSEMLMLDYGDQDLLDVTYNTYRDQVFSNARYLPTNLIQYFYDNKIKADVNSNAHCAIYTVQINKTIVSLYIDKKSKLLDKITTLNDDDLFGDVLSTIHYTNYAKHNKVSIPSAIVIEKVNGKLRDTITLSYTAIVAEAPVIVSRPTDYKMKDAVVIVPEIKTEKYSENIHFVELKHTDDKVMIVEFSDFMLVAEAPINSENGELIIAEAKKIAPHKPIKYFVFGHYHPHYLGGMRPFIHKGAKIICSKMDEEYVTYLAQAQHSLKPDSLHMQPKPLLIEEMIDSMTITDGSFEMKIYFIGAKSQHTKDFLIYYFPKEKMLFEDDLVWRKKEGPITKLSPREAGLYNAVKELGLDIKTIVQSWPVKDYGVKTVIAFEELVKAAELK